MSSTSYASAVAETRAIENQGNRSRLIVFPGEWDEFYR